MGDNLANTVPLINDTRSRESDPSDRLITTFLIAHSRIFRELAELREEGWNNPQGDKHFQKQRRDADEASYKVRKGFYNLMQRIGDELQAASGTLSLPKPHAEVLDICMAPGGYSASALKYSPHACVSGITLPKSLGGHQLLIPYGRIDPRVDVQLADITMLTAEYGVTDIPEGHPDVLNFSLKRPWATKSFDLVFCDGQVLRTHAPHIESYRERREAGRLSCSQLILAMQRIKPGGTFIMLLHKVEIWRTMKLLSVFDAISQIELFKPVTSHKTRGSFYLIAKNVQPHHPEALAAINEWKAAWKNATFPVSTDEECQNPPDFVEEHVQDEEVSGLLASFGERLIELGEPVWQIQKNALREAPWFKNKEAKPAETSAGQVGVPASTAPSDPVNVSSMMGNLQLGR
ncbi:hypothetical protein HO133_006847 [Letharia lupina]|uniref:Ribosomal RNA methyltransferase FtsJ domain-containing protein n=1 Tax=Letharia lupina TaxID=560253 RepID=A0A8H6C6I6_9LECA|nr:uncharacterized protein HO133_006847 [Letharia lupina]KAF6217509.1 hypothetical protein HO133_006847 [Letharia lupina]